MINKDEINEHKHTIAYNVDLMKWYFTKNKNIISDDEKDKVFHLMSYAFLEDHYCFMRLMLYIANTRKTDEQEISYKIMIHFLSILFPDITLANIDMFLTLGKKDDVLYFLQCANISANVLRYINHKAKTDSDFKILLNGKMIKKKIERKIKYKPDFKSNTTWNDFMFNLLDDPIFNGVTL